ncbi:hypothetical protein ACFPRL_22255 [Pseudoclavibacter helvolus]
MVSGGAWDTADAGLRPGLWPSSRPRPRPSSRPRLQSPASTSGQRPQGSGLRREERADA